MDLRTTPSPTQAGDWGLVLAAAGIAYRLDERDGCFAIVVDPADAATAESALAGFEAEGAPEAPPPAPDVGPSVLGPVVAAGLGAMFLVSGPWTGGSRWFEHGAASAERIAAGEWWRAITALTLHADVLHLLGNLVATLIFVSAVARWLGGGLAAALILFTAGLANLLTAAVHRGAFVSVGASTATFAALGLVAGLQVSRRLRVRTRRGYAWVPLGAGLGIYAMLGVGSGADLYAHLFGLGLGALAGLVVALANVRAPRLPGQIALGIGSAAAVVGAWAIALIHS
jgi:membrane associated rhomboid family serine protease